MTIGLLYMYTSCSINIDGYRRSGTNLKVWAHVQREAPDFFVVPLRLFWLYKYNQSFLVSAFVMVSTVWSVSCLLLFYSLSTGK